MNMSKSVLGARPLELPPDWHVREPQRRGGPRAGLARAIHTAFVPAQSSLMSLLWHVREKRGGQTCASPRSRHSSTALCALLRRRWRSRWPPLRLQTSVRLWTGQNLKGESIASSPVSSDTHASSPWARELLTPQASPEKQRSISRLFIDPLSTQRPLK